MKRTDPGSKTPAIVLIVNADDFGLTHGVNQGIIQTFEQGIVTSASLMVHAEAAAEAGAYARDHPEVSVGLHLYLGDWVYRDGAWVERDGAWVERDVVAPSDDREAIATEVTRQMERFQQLVGRLPTHLDVHQHRQRDEPLRSIALAQAAALGIPLRLLHPQIRYIGSFYGQCGEGEPLPELLTIENMLTILRELEPGINELGCHPGFAAGLDDTYRWEREREIETLCDPRVRAEIDALGIHLISFGDISLD